MDQEQFESEAFMFDPRITVALLNLTILGLVGLVHLGYSIIDDGAYYLPLLAVPTWCLYIQFSVRRKKSARERWLRKRQWQEAMIGTFSILVMSSLIIWPILDAIAILS